MNTVRPIEITLTQPLQTESNLFSHLFDGRTIVEAKGEFDKFLNSINVLPFGMSGPGPTHYAWLACGSWTAESIRGNRSLNRQPTDSARSIDIRVEIGLSIDTPTLILLVKDATGSYLGGTKVNGMADGEIAGLYRRRREEFIIEFRKHCEVKDLMVRNNRMWLGRAKYDYAGKTTQEVREWLESTVEGIAQAIGLAMWEIDEHTGFLAERGAEIDEPFLMTATASVTVDGGPQRPAATEEVPFPMASETN